MDPIWAQTIAISAATIIGPISAIVGSMYLQSRKEKKREKVQMVMDLVANRMHPSRAEFGKIMNIVPLVFPQDKLVLTAFDRLRLYLEGPNRILRDDPNLQNLVSDMLVEMSKKCGLKFSHIQLRALNYSSGEYELRDTRLQLALESLPAIARALEENSTSPHKAGDEL
ncbi:MAG: DUF6680 family protein [Hyphomonas oceanitis]|uniref:DUF6680 domain-containing protein n=1 Tax=Hyphomonas oceanitis SCH89 TaxID=1280953 RepID=A0A059G3C4_9PROT|nr:DUF6680 family protein [Hyphomonas oceanitis]KDA01306.1 hypothetical protein HOC_16211 [Hyphomonas oceanitis SCH89]